LRFEFDLSTLKDDILIQIKAGEPSGYGVNHLVCVMGTRFAKIF